MPNSQKSPKLPAVNNQRSVTKCPRRGATKQQQKHQRQTTRRTGKFNRAEQKYFVRSVRSVNRQMVEWIVIYRCLYKRYPSLKFWKCSGKFFKRERAKKDNFWNYLCFANNLQTTLLEDASFSRGFWEDTDTERKVCFERLFLEGSALVLFRFWYFFYCE